MALDSVVVRPSEPVSHGGQRKQRRRVFDYSQKKDMSELGNEQIKELTGQDGEKHE